ncbi:MAG: carboxypeptidase regulatory-like domain-containing protein [Gemmatimonadaceae bacterium]|nr:carboxypeptidase regulatory-like domain-containing protein [Gemmatimonadaceae bacterium]
MTMWRAARAIVQAGACAMLLLTIGAVRARASHTGAGRAAPTLDAQRIPAARVVGIVYDSISHATLSGAVVQLVSQRGTLRLTATTDSTGRYAFAAVERGTFLLGFYHAKLDSLGVEAPTSTIDVRDDEVLAIDLAVPAVATVLRRACGSGAMRDSSGAVMGYVRSAATTGPVEGASVRGRWSEIVIGKRGAEVKVREVKARSADDGWFTLCEVPAGGLVLVNAAAGRDSGATLEVSVPNDGLLVRDLLVRDVEVSPHAGGAVSSTVRGTVRTPYGEPLAGARVRLYGETREVRSNARGEFTLAGVPAGTRMLELRALGYAPRRELVDLVAQQEVVVDLPLEEFPTTIDTIRVYGARPALGDVMAGFVRRRALSQGVFLDPEGLERRQPLAFSDLLRGIAGVDVVTTDGVRAVKMRGSDGEARCEPELVVDGLRLPRYESDIDHLIPVSIVRALEVYPRRIQAPVEFQAPDCGSIVVWTGARGWLGKRGAVRR